MEDGPDDHHDGRRALTAQRAVPAEGMRFRGRWSWRAASYAAEWLATARPVGRQTRIREDTWRTRAAWSGCCPQRMSSISAGAGGQRGDQKRMIFQTGRIRHGVVAQPSRCLRQMLRRWRQVEVRR